MKDNISLIAAAAGGFMISIAVAGILRAAPIQSLQAQPSSSSSQITQLQLKTVSSEAPVKNTFNKKVSSDAMRVIPNRVLNNTLEDKAISGTGNPDWAVQYLGFINWLSSVEGTLKQQDYQLKKLDYKLAKKDYEDNEITKEVLAKKAAKYRQAKEEFQRV
jgi:hypothetical protein